jgi:AmmeMemoRadiSam system protein A
MPELNVTDEEKQQLLSLARESVAACVTGQPRPRIAEPAGILNEQLGCFVTLHNGPNLRGCIGTFQPQRPLAEQVVDMAQAAARDPRFVMTPVTADEIPLLTVEVSLLSPLEETNQPEQLEIGKHGIYMTRGMQSGCFLPEVATDQGWDVEEFLGYCCSHKAGLAPDAWKDPKTRVYLFTSEKFSDHPQSGGPGQVTD